MLIITAIIYCPKRTRNAVNEAAGGSREIHRAPGTIEGDRSVFSTQLPNGRQGKGVGQTEFGEAGEEVRKGPLRRGGKERERFR